MTSKPNDEPHASADDAWLRGLRGEVDVAAGARPGADADALALAQGLAVRASLHAGAVDAARDAVPSSADGGWAEVLRRSAAAAVSEIPVAHATIEPPAIRTPGAARRPWPARGAWAWVLGAGACAALVLLVGRPPGEAATDASTVEQGGTLRGTSPSTRAGAQLRVPDPGASARDWQQRLSGWGAVVELRDGAPGSIRMHIRLASTGDRRAVDAFLAAHDLYLDPDGTLLVTLVPAQGR